MPATPNPDTQKGKMTDPSPDDARLRSTETQMRHALGLRGDTPPRSSASGSHRQRHRFVRDGEVPVTVIRRDHQPEGEHSANQLDAARQAIQSEATAKDRAERLLAEAQAMIRDLQTKLGHERLAKDEALETVRRLETEARVAAHAVEAAEAELAAERVTRRNAEDALAEALEARQEAEERLRESIANRQAPKQSLAPLKGTGRPMATGIGPKELAARDIDREPHSKSAKSVVTVDDGSMPKQTRRRQRPDKDSIEASEIVEWWMPGWREKFR
jgi:hypothetical protein